MDLGIRKKKADKMAKAAAALPTYDADILTPNWDVVPDVTGKLHAKWYTQ
jgi:hypothetical protein